MTDCGFCEDGLRQVVGKPVGVLEACPYCRGQGSVLPDESERDAPAQPPAAEDEEGMGLTKQETAALARFLAARHVEAVDMWLDWGDVPNLGEFVFDRLADAVAEVAKGLYRQASSVIDAAYLFEMANDAAGACAGASRPSSRPVAPSEGLSGVEAARSVLEASDKDGAK